MYSWTEGVCAAARTYGYIPAEIEHIEEGVDVNESGDILHGLRIFNVPVGEERYVTSALREKARHVGKVARQYIEDIEEKYPQEPWTMLLFSLHHRITY